MIIKGKNRSDKQSQTSYSTNSSKPELGFKLNTKFGFNEYELHKTKHSLYKTKTDNSN